uniref:Uncharacterized protein n=1 Tax=Gasterosteus aculeatus TaxID=69293 RepID=G3NWU9_GASAC
MRDQFTACTRSVCRRLVCGFTPRCYDVLSCSSNRISARQSQRGNAAAKPVPDPHPAPHRRPSAGGHETELQSAGGGGSGSGPGADNVR